MRWHPALLIKKFENIEKFSKKESGSFPHHTPLRVIRAPTFRQSQS